MYTTHKKQGGRGAPSARRFGDGCMWPAERSVQAQRASTPAYGKLLTTIRLDDLQSTSSFSSNSPKITQCKDVASFNWLDKSEPTMIVPGSPPAWTPPANTRKLAPDTGRYLRNRNAARFPAHPLEPAVRAVLTQSPSLATTLTDIFGCGSTFGNLLRASRGDAADEADKKPFRILVEAVGDTVFLTRRENSANEIIADIVGVGHSFAEEYTKWGRDCQGTESHQRIVQYKFAGLTCLVRFEADGYLSHLATRAETKSNSTKESYGGACFRALVRAR